MNVNIERIKTDFDAFCQRIEAYRKNIDNPERHKDFCVAAYEGLYTLIQRIKKELASGALNNQESNICCQIREDEFLKGLQRLRTVGTHIQSDTAKKMGCLSVYVPSGPPVEIPGEVSAGSLFSNKIFPLPKPSLGIDKINHLENLNAAEKRIGNKLEKIFTS